MLKKYGAQAAECNQTLRTRVRHSSVQIATKSKNTASCRQSEMRVTKGRQLPEIKTERTELQMFRYVFEVTRSLWVQRTLVLIKTVKSTVWFQKYKQRFLRRPSSLNLSKSSSVFWKKFKNDSVVPESVLEVCGLFVLLVWSDSPRHKGSFWSLESVRKIKKSEILRIKLKYFKEKVAVEVMLHRINL